MGVRAGEEEGRVGEWVPSGVGGGRRNIVLLYYGREVASYGGFPGE